MKPRPFGVTTTQLAKICGVSQGTVDRAINGRKGISPKTKEAVLKAARDYGYRPNIHASRLSGGKSHLIGVVVFDLDNAYFSDLVMELEALCRPAGDCAVVMFSHKDPAREKECLQQLWFLGVDGIVLCPVSQGGGFAEFLHSLQTPVVTVGNRIQDVPFVGIDDMQAMQEATRYALQCGYEELLYVTAALPKQEEVNAYAQQRRLQGFLSAAAAVPHRVLERVEDVKAALPSGRRCAVLCSTDYFALPLLPLCQRNQVGLMGFDGSSVLTRSGVKLDSVAYDSEGAAKAALDIVWGVRPPEDVTIRHKMVARGSLVSQLPKK